MKLHLAQSPGSNLITGHGPGWIEVNATRHRQNLIVLPALLVTDWAATRFDLLEPGHFARIAALAPDIVLLGTGASHRFAHPRLTQALTDAGIGLECMSTAAACRTYNILLAEGRHVAAALLVEDLASTAPA